MVFSTTISRYDNGLVNKKTIVGAGTDIETTYTYNDLLLPLTITYIDNNEPVTTQKIETKIIYDDVFKRPVSIVEEKIGVSMFSRIFEYDALGRISLETKIAKAGAKTSTVTIRNVYKNDNLFQIKDLNNKVLWQANTVNAEGQILESILGNGIKMTNTYNTDGYLSKIQHDNTTAPASNIMTLTTLFDKTADNLESRTNSIFQNYTESFKYDEVNRLKKFTNKLGIEETQNYDGSGKITDNHLGTYQYDAVKKYQNTAITLSPESTGYYANREGFFNDSMEDKTGFGLVRHPGTEFYSYDETKSHTGKTSLKLSNVTTTEQYVHCDKWLSIDNAVDTQYTYSAWVYSDNPQAEVVLFMNTPEETGYFSVVDNAVTNEVNHWVKIEKTVLVPAHIKKLNIRLDNNSQGNVWFDDVVIRKTSDLGSDLKQLNITYNAFKSPVQIEETGVDKVSFTYNANNQRSTMYYGSMDDKLLRPMRKHYSSDRTMEIKENTLTSSSEFIFYIGGDGYGAPVAVKSDGTSQNYLYLHRDYQGSIVAITDDRGKVAEKRLFDAWGNIIKVQDGAGNALARLTVLDRGYTGHEHLQSTGLINMNARLYDPMIRRFLQTDNYIQDPKNTQNYNQYGYVFNNPTKFVDSTGNYSYDPPGGTNHRDGDKWDDDYGSWIYNAQFQTWFDVNGTRDITADAINLDNLVLGGNMKGYSSDFTSFSGMVGNINDSGGYNLQKASLFDGNVSFWDLGNIFIGIYGYGIAHGQSLMIAEANVLKNRNTLTALGKLAKLQSSIAGVDKVAKVLGVAGAALSISKVSYEYFNGKDLTAGQVFDVGVSVVLALATITNPVALVGFAAYGILDATGALDSIKSSLGGDTVILESKFK